MATTDFGTWRALIVGLAAILCALCGPARPALAQADDTPAPLVVVMDASGSMQALKDGRAKRVEAARAVRAGLAAAPRTQPIGLVAYGHRRKGACDDIEEILPPTTQRRPLYGALRALDAQGKTPVGDATIAAARLADYEEQPVSVLVIADGPDTCGRDLCAAGEILEKTGVDLTVHVIGFDVDESVSAPLRCLADRTGGRYRYAADADGLAAALDYFLVQGAPPPAPSSAELWATDLIGGPEFMERVVWRVTARDTGAVVFADTAVGRVRLTLPHGYYTVEALHAPPADALGQSEADNQPVPIARGQAELFVPVEGAASLAIGLEVAIDARLSAPREAEAGDTIEVTWQGPRSRLAAVVIADRGQPDTSPRNAYRSIVDATLGSPLPIILPAEPGAYEVRLTLDDPPRVLARQPIIALPASVSLEAPDTVGVAAALDVIWTGPSYDGDFIGLGPVGLEVDTNRYAYPSSARTADGSPARLWAPDTPGAYELRYVAGRGHPTTILARRPITVTDAPVSLTAPLSAPAGAWIDVAFEGPAMDEAIVAVTAVDAGETASQGGRYFTADTARGSPVRLRAPGVPGRYEIRYILERTGRVLARQSFTAEPMSIAFGAPESVPIGAPVPVAFQGPLYEDTLLAIGKAGTDDTAGRYGYISYVADLARRTATLQAPAEPGTYELRYIIENAPETVVVARWPLTVTDVPASLEVPDTVAPGAPVLVSATGPGAPGDMVAIGPVGTPESTDRYGYWSFALVAEAAPGAPIALEAPQAPGTYEVRYVMAGGARVLARAPVTVAPAAPDSLE